MVPSFTTGANKMTPKNNFLPHKRMLAQQQQVQLIKQICWDYQRAVKEYDGHILNGVVKTVT